jgi:hypothetical protein
MLTANTINEAAIVNVPAALGNRVLFWGAFMRITSLCLKLRFWVWGEEVDAYAVHQGKFNASGVFQTGKGVAENRV